jgi:hypothetical protein
MTDVEEFLRCSKPLFEEHPGDDDFAYTFAGSIFAASFRERAFSDHGTPRLGPNGAGSGKDLAERTKLGI